MHYSHGKLQPGSRLTDSLSVVPGSLTYPCIGLQARAFATSASTSIAKDGHSTAGLRRRKGGELSALLNDVSLPVNIHRLAEQTRRILQSLFQERGVPAFPGRAQSMSLKQRMDMIALTCQLKSLHGMHSR